MFNSNRPERESSEYKAWRFGVFSRDGWCCIKCQTKGKPIEAHHIKRWADEPRLRYAISNGATLCKDCHGLITGREELYEDELKKIIAQNKALKQNGQVRKGYSKPNTFKPKYRPRNPFLRF